MLLAKLAREASVTPEREQWVKVQPGELGRDQGGNNDNSPKFMSDLRSQHAGPFGDSKSEKKSQMV